MDFPTSFLPVWQSVRDGIKGKKLRVNSADVPVVDDFFNKHPELRNSKDTPRYPGLVLRTMAPVLGDLIVNEPVKSVVTVTDAACFLEGMGVPALALANGQTLQLLVGTEVPGDPRATSFASLTVTFTAGSFANIGAATPAEVAAVLSAQLPGLVVAVQLDGLTVRVTHGTLGAYSSLQVIGGTATALRGAFPAYDVWGRDAGDEVQYIDPPAFYHCPFQLVWKSKQLDHHAFLGSVVDRLFKIRGGPNQRAVMVVGRNYEVRWEGAADDPLADEGLFFTTTTYTVRNVPILDPDAVRPWNGGNPPVGGGLPEQLPLVEEFLLRIAPVAPHEPLVGLLDSEYELMLVPVP